MYSERKRSGTAGKSVRKSSFSENGKTSERSFHGAGGTAGRPAAAGRGRKSSAPAWEARNLSNSENPGAGERIRLNKFIASSGLYSRREADRLMEMGEVTVDDEIAQPGTMVTGREKIKVRDQIIRAQDRKVVVAYYKPVGVTVTKSDPHAKVTLEEVFRYPIHLTYAGRLDRDSEGLLLMTNDGALIDAMMRSANEHEKEYIVRTRGKISDEDLHQMSKGIWLKDLEVKTKPCRIERLGEYTFRIVLTQGLNRQIRRMCKAKGHEVKSLKRVRVLNITVKGLQPGMQRELTQDERMKLYEAVGLPLTD